MIRRDYILRMIEEFIQKLARISHFKKGQLWEEAAGAIDAEFKRLAGAGAQAVSQMSETELWAKLIQGEPTQVMHRDPGSRAKPTEAAGFWDHLLPAAQQPK